MRQGYYQCRSKILCGFVYGTRSVLLHLELVGEVLKVLIVVSFCVFLKEGGGGKCEGWCW